SQPMQKRPILNKGNRMKSVPDEDVMLQVRSGEVEMLGVLFDRYQTPLYNFCAKMTQDRVVSEDLVQEVFLRILRYRETYRPGTSFRAWMYQIASNTRIDQVRKTRPETPFVSEHVAATSLSDSAQQKQEAMLLQRALLHLPEDKREILVLSRFQELKYDEIARLLGCEVGAVKVRVHRALQQLREIFLQLESGAPATDLPRTHGDSIPPTVPPNRRLQ
ncbi:MAG: RNA polymerase sigma factor, partial [Chthoniobacterales bacterium]